MTTLNDGKLYTIPGGEVVIAFVRDGESGSFDSEFAAVGATLHPIELLANEPRWYFLAPPGDISSYTVYQDGGVYAERFSGEYETLPLSATESAQSPVMWADDEPAFTVADLVEYDHKALADLLSWLNLDGAL